MIKNTKKHETKPAAVGGFINENHSDVIADVFDEELAKKVKNAKPGETFLSILMREGRI